MSTPYDQLLGDNDPFKGSTATSWGGPTQGGQGLRPPTYSYPNTSPQRFQAPSIYQEQQQSQRNAENALLYGGGNPTAIQLPRGPSAFGSANDWATGGNASWGAPSVQNFGGAPDSQWGAPRGGQDPLSNNSLFNAGMQDVQAAQQAANNQWDRKNNLATSMSSQLQTNRNAMTSSLGSTTKSTRDAEQNFLNSINEYTDRTAQDSSAIANGIRQSYKSQMDEANHYTRADGTMKTQAEIDAEKASIQQGVNAQVQQTLAPIATQYRDALAGMKENYSNFLTANAQIRAAQQLQAIQYDLTGRNYLYEYVNQNPETHVNLLDTLLAMANVQMGRNAANTWGGGVALGNAPTTRQGPVGMSFHGSGGYDPNSGLGGSAFVGESGGGHVAPNSSNGVVR